MAGSKKHKTEQQKSKQKERTARNKIKKYEKALLTANGEAKNIIMKKLDFYRQRTMN